MGWRDPNSWRDATRLEGPFPDPAAPRAPDFRTAPFADDVTAIPVARAPGRGIPGFADSGPDGGATGLRPAPEGAAGLLERLVYVSCAAPGLDTAAVYGIIRGAHAGNAPAGVTGALVFLDGWFVQVLEAPAAELDACLDRIRDDRRHAGLQLRQRERVHARVFPGQPMALRTRACLDPDLLTAFGYRAGFPVSDFPADVLLEFVVQACCRMR